MHGREPDRESDHEARMVVSPTASPAAKIVWHDLECGLYSADLPLWRELASEHPKGPILDVGAGTGRVSCDLALVGRRVIALDHDPELLAELRARASGLDVQTLCADARGFALEDDERLMLCLVPMQTVQLLGGSAARLEFLRAADRQMRPGGLLAVALVTELEPFDCREGGPRPSPDSVRIDGLLYTSQALSVSLGEQRITIERERRIVRDSDRESDAGSDAETNAGSDADGNRDGRPHAAEPGFEARIERDIIELDRLTARELQREAAAVGFSHERARTIEPTDEHTGSTVVMLRA